MYKLMNKREWNMRLVIVSLMGVFGLMLGYVVADPEATSELTGYFKSRLDMPLNPEAEAQAVEEDMGALRQDVDASGEAMLGDALGVDITPLSVNINAATADEMADGLLGLGPVIAAAIVAYREASGGFETPQDLVAVAGISEAIFAKNLPMIVVE
jgi:competence ComEA-like helix-hairpin-helix protein|tara:strand:+ start:288 stop:755 length:468 start_codon:yes stop_codon:yes gene_type:complete